MDFFTELIKGKVQIVFIANSRTEYDEIYKKITEPLTENGLHEWYPVKMKADLNNFRIVVGVKHNNSRN